MCDYSLGGIRTRLAVEGEELVIHRFQTGSLGLASPAELEALQHEVSGWRSAFNTANSVCAVCIPPGARLVLRDIPQRLQSQLGLGEIEQVTFIQKDVPEFRHRDAVRFQNNQEILLQRLSQGQRAIVRSLSLEEEPEEQLVRKTAQLQLDYI
jgi:hypothetical protein